MATQGQTYHCNDQATSNPTSAPADKLPVDFRGLQGLRRTERGRHGRCDCGNLHPALKGKRDDDESDDHAGCGDVHRVHVATVKEAADEDEEDESDQGVDEDSCDDARAAKYCEAEAPTCTIQVSECRAASSRHDDWLRRGVFLAQTLLLRKTLCALGVFCQLARYATATAIPRLVGSVCPPEKKTMVESHMPPMYKLMFFSRPRCPLCSTLVPRLLIFCF